MDELHLLQDCRFARLSRTYMTLALAIQWTRIYRTKQQHLDLIALGELVTPELIFDLFMTLLSLLLLRAHTTTHCVSWRNFSGASDCRLDSAPAEIFCLRVRDDSQGYRYGYGGRNIRGCHVTGPGLDKLVRCL